MEQATILVTPISEGKDEYTTPAFPVPQERDLNNYILVSPADSGIKPIYVYLKDDPRDHAATVSGNGSQIETGQKWLDLSATNNGEGAKIPSDIADKLRGRHYDNFRKFREDLWLEISKDPELL
nr:S-type pyocin domain-containing protein [Atlantibacter hermannii]